MMLLGLSLLPLVLGPLLVHFFVGRPRLIHGLDAFVFVSVIGLVFVRVLPEAVARGGLPALGASIAGLALPVLFERHQVGNAQRRHGWLALVAFFGFAVHGMLDGLALAAGHLHARGGGFLAWGVLLHRLPEGMAIWWYARRHVGPAPAVAIVAALVLFSLVGFVLPHVHGAILGGIAWDILQALLAGVIAHVILHEPLGRDSSPTTGGWQGASFVGTALAVGALMLLGSADPTSAFAVEPGRLPALRTFVSLALESAAPVLVGFTAAGLLRAFVPDRVYRWMGRGHPLAQAMKGAAVGAPLSICSCSILPIYRTLVAANVSTRSALAFLLTAPELGLATILLSYSLLGSTMASFRVVSACMLGVTVSLCATLRRRGVDLTPEALLSRPHRWTPALSVGARLRAGLAYGFGELVDHTAPWILVGLGLAAILEPLVSPDLFRALPPGAQIPVAALVGIPLYVCAAGSTPLVALLMHKGLSGGAGLALLLSGPATNIATFGFLARLHGKRLAVSVALGILVASVAAGFAYHLLPVPAPQMPLHELAEARRSPWNWVWLCLVALLFAASLLRQGARAFVGQLFTIGGHEPDRRAEKGNAQWPHVTTSPPDSCPSACSPDSSERERRRCSTGS
jgi:hypothetical protein